MFFLFRFAKIRFSVGTVAERMQKNDFLGFLSIVLCVEKKSNVLESDVGLLFHSY